MDQLVVQNAKLADQSFSNVKGAGGAVVKPSKKTYPLASSRPVPLSGGTPPIP